MTLRIDDIGTVDEIRMNRLAPLLETVDRAVKAIEEAEVPALGTFEDAQGTIYEHQKVTENLGPDAQNLRWELLAIVSRNEQVMAAFREEFEVDLALLSRMLDSDLLAIQAQARDATATGTTEEA